jgi:hypothetical protein
LSRRRIYSRYLALEAYIAEALLGGIAAVDQVHRFQLHAERAHSIITLPSVRITGTAFAIIGTDQTFPLIDRANGAAAPCLRF